MVVPAPNFEMTLDNGKELFEAGTVVGALVWS